MLTLSQWMAFTGLAIFLVLIPGADTVLVIRTTIQQGRRTALIVALGICTGLFIWGAATAWGLAALFQAPLAHDLLSVAGAIYLIYLGIKTLKDRSNPIEGERPLTGSVFLTGFLANLLNPKVAVFYLSVFAQFINPGANAVLQGLALATVHFLLSMVWFVILTALLTRVLSDSWRKRVSLASGSVLIAFGLSLLVPVAVSAAATPVTAPISINSYSLGSVENEFTSLTATSNGYLLVGTFPADPVAPSWNLSPSLGGSDAVVAAVDLTGKPLWATRIGTANDDAGFLTTVDAQGEIWVVGVTAAATVGQGALPGSLDPDGVGLVNDDEGPSGPNQLLVASLSSDGQIKSQTVVPLDAGLSIQPADMVATAAGVVIAGTVATDESGSTRGVLVTLSAQLQPTFSYVGSSSTSISDVEATPAGLQLAGASSEVLGGKALLGIRDAYTATWSNGILSNVTRSGSKGVDRTWTSLTSTKDGFLFAGWAETAGKVETVVTSLKRNGKVIFSNRYPPSQDQLVFSGNRVALSSKSASTLLPGWKPKGVDLLFVTLDSKGKTSALMALSGATEEELLAITPKMALALRTSDPLGKGIANTLLVRISR